MKTETEQRTKPAVPVDSTRLVASRVRSMQVTPSRLDEMLVLLQSAGNTIMNVMAIPKAVDHQTEDVGKGVAKGAITMTTDILVLYIEPTVELSQRVNNQ